MQIIVGGQSSDLWHKTLNALWDDRVIAGLADDAYRVLGAYLRLRHHETGLATATASDLMAMTGRSRTYVYRARQRLLESEHRLLETRSDLGRDTYHVLPGWAFRTRGNSSQPGDGTVPARGNSSQPRDALKEVREFKESESDVREGVDDECVEILKAGNPRLPGASGSGFSDRDARGLLRMTAASRRDVETACRNADALARHKDPSKRLRDWRAYMAKQLASGVTLMAPLQAQDDDRDRNRDIVQRLLGEQGDTDAARMVAEWWNGLGNEQRARALAGPERGRTDEWIWGALVAKASRSRR